MTRKRRLGLTGVSGLLALVLGSGLIAVVSDSARSNGNSAQAGTYTAPQHDLKVARAPITTSCADATYTDGPFGAAVDITGLQFGNSASSGQWDVFCLKNAGLGGHAGRLTAVFINVADTEVGACEPSESAEGQDSTCAAGEAGELRPLIGGMWQWCSPPDPESCGGVDFVPFSTLESPVELDASLAPGETVAVNLQVLLGEGTDQQKLKAQTDRMQWDIVFTLEDVPSS